MSLSLTRFNMFRTASLGRLLSTPFYLALLIILWIPGLSSAGVGPVTGKFELLDHKGNLVNESSYDGKIRLVFFGFTNCPDICPTTMAQVTRVIKMLGEDSEQVQTIFVTIDPENDSVERMGSYVTAFHPSIVGLTGSKEQIEKAADAFNVSYGLGVSDEFYHSSYLYVMGRKGEFIDLFGYGTRAKIITKTLKELLETI